MDKDGRLLSGGMTGCKYCKHGNLQKQCTYFIKASHDRRCMYLKFDEYCDYHEDMKCAKEKESQRMTSADHVRKHFANAKSKTLAEQHQEQIDEYKESILC